MKQRGFGWIQIVIILVALGAGFAAVKSYNHAIEKAQKLEADNAELAQAHKDQLADNMWLRVENTRVQGLLATREQLRQERNQVKEQINAKLDDVFRKDGEARAWGAVRVPPAVLDGMRRPGSGALNQDPARGAAGVANR